MFLYSIFRPCLVFFCFDSLLNSLLSSLFLFCCLCMLLFLLLRHIFWQILCILHLLFLQSLCIYLMVILFEFVLLFLLLYRNCLIAILLLDVCLFRVLGVRLISCILILLFWSFLLVVVLDMCLFVFCLLSYDLMLFFVDDFLVDFGLVWLHLFLIFYLFSKKFHSLQISFIDIVCKEW